MNNFGTIVKDIAMESAAISMIAIFVQNIILTRALGTSASLFVIRKKYNIGIFGLIMAIITTLSSCIIYFLRYFIDGLTYQYFLRPFIYVVVVGIVYVAVLLFCSRFLKKYIVQIRPMIHLSAFNGAVLGALLLSETAKMNFWGHLSFGLGTGIGFILASYLIALGFERLNSEKIPRSFRGFPITLIYIGILSLAFYGLIGHELSM
ncbi:MAG: Rnf-Nqr domain containing protein [Oscillospiraceae bacterium]